MAKEVLGLINAPEMDVKAVVAAATKGAPTASDRVKGQLPKGKAEAAAEAVVPGPAPPANPNVDPREPLLTATEAKDFSAAFQNWLVGETLAGRQMPDLKTQRNVRSGLVDTLMGARPNQGGAFMQFLGME